MDKLKFSGRVFGSCFIGSFFAYGIGSALLETSTRGTANVGIAPHHSFNIVLAALLVVFVHTVFNTVVLVLMHQQLKSLYSFLANFYLFMGFVGTFLLVVGSIFMLAFLPLSSDAALKSNTAPVSLLAEAGKDLNFYCYQFGMAFWGAGGIAMCYLLATHNLLPRWLPRLGLFAYCVFIGGTFAELFGQGYGLVLSVPGGMFELTLGVWCIVKGMPERKLTA